MSEENKNKAFTTEDFQGMSAKKCLEVLSSHPCQSNFKGEALVFLDVVIITAKGLSDLNIRQSFTITDPKAGVDYSQLNVISANTPQWVSLACNNPEIVIQSIDAISASVKDKVSWLPKFIVEFLTKSIANRAKDIKDLTEAHSFPFALATINELLKAFEIEHEAEKCPAVSAVAKFTVAATD